MKYLILIWSNPWSRAAWEGFSEEEQTSGLAIYAKLVEDLAGSGELIATEALGDASLGRGVNVTESGVTTTDGPFAEVKEQLAGFFLVDCEGEERAVEIAARIPEAAHGLVEVRPVRTFSGMEM